MSNGKYILIGIGIGLVIGFVLYLSFSPQSEPEITEEVITNLESSEVNLTSEKEIEKDMFSNTDRLHWSHMPVTYKIKNEEECKVKVKERIKLAFEKIQSETGDLVSFEETDEIPDISIFCNFLYYEEIYGTFGERSSMTSVYGDALPSLYEDKDNLIKNATINFYGAGYVCGTGYPATEVHEILHIFGFAHNYETVDVMSPETEEQSVNCKIDRINEKYISCLKNIYSNGMTGDCININLLKFCKEGYILGSDNECYEDCEVGYVLGEDYKCYEECGKGYYCTEGSICVNEECV